MSGWASARAWRAWGRSRSATSCRISTVSFLRNCLSLSWGAWTARGNPGRPCSPVRPGSYLRPIPGDPLVLAVGRHLGLLGIEPHTRRRNRMNGVVESISATGFSVRVQQSFGNCPKYIQARKPEFVPRVGGVVSRSPVLDADAVRALRSADTFFIASAYPAGESDARAHGIDVSHRGGNPGFIRVEDGVLRIPDYVGNNFFNTLGNLAINPRAGVLVVDFASGDLLFFAATAEILWSGVEVDAVPKAKRLLVMKVTEMVRLAGSLGLKWGEVEVSPFLSGT